METDGKQYRNCLGWRTSAGFGVACYDMCEEAQRKACNDQQETDSRHCDFCEGIITKAVQKTFTTTTVYGPEFKCTKVEVKKFCSKRCADKYEVPKT